MNQYDLASNSLFSNLLLLFFILLSSIFIVLGLIQVVTKNGFDIWSASSIFTSAASKSNFYSGTGAIFIGLIFILLGVGIFLLGLWLKNKIY